MKQCRVQNIVCYFDLDFNHKPVFKYSTRIKVASDKEEVKDDFKHRIFDRFDAPRYYNPRSDVLRVPLSNAGLEVMNCPLCPNLWNLCEMSKIKFKNLAKKEIDAFKKEIHSLSGPQKMLSIKMEYVKNQGKIKIPDFFKKIYPNMIEREYLNILDDKYFLEKEVLICPECYCNTQTSTSNLKNTPGSCSSSTKGKLIRQNKNEIHSGILYNNIATIQKLKKKGKKKQKLKPLFIDRPTRLDSTAYDDVLNTSDYSHLRGKSKNRLWLTLNSKSKSSLNKTKASLSLSDMINLKQKLPKRKFRALNLNRKKIKPPKIREKKPDLKINTLIARFSLHGNKYRSRFGKEKKNEIETIRKRKLKKIRNRRLKKAYLNPEKDFYSTSVSFSYKTKNRTLSLNSSKKNYEEKKKLRESEFAKSGMTTSKFFELQAVAEEDQSYRRSKASFRKFASGSVEDQLSSFAKKTLFRSTADDIVLE